MARLHGMLESDAISNEDEFCKLIEVLIKHALIPPIVIASLLFVDFRLIEAWAKGEDVPDSGQWPFVQQKVTNLLYSLVLQAA